MLSPFEIYRNIPFRPDEKYFCCRSMISRNRNSCLRLFMQHSWYSLSFHNIIDNERPKIKHNIKFDLPIWAEIRSSKLLVVSRGTRTNRLLCMWFVISFLASPFPAHSSLSDYYCTLRNSVRYEMINDGEHRCKVCTTPNFFFTNIEVDELRVHGKKVRPRCLICYVYR